MSRLPIVGSDNDLWGVILMVNLPVNVGSNYWRGLNLKFSGSDASPDYTQGQPIIAWPYSILPRAYRKGDEGGLVNSVHYTELEEGTEDRLLDWLRRDMSGAESFKKISERQETIKVELSADSRPLEQIFKELFPDKEFLGDMLSRYDVIRHFVFLSWQQDHPDTNN